jgi:hypothetical protein
MHARCFVLRYSRSPVSTDCHVDMLHSLMPWYHHPLPHPRQPAPRLFLAPPTSPLSTLRLPLSRSNRSAPTSQETSAQPGPSHTAFKAKPILTQLPVSHTPPHPPSPPDLPFLRPPVPRVESPDEAERTAFLAGESCGPTCCWLAAHNVMACPCVQMLRPSRQQADGMGA